MFSPDILKKICFETPPKEKEKTSAEASKSLKASLTVEASVVLPLFLFAMLSIVYLLEGIRFSSRLENAMRESAMKMSAYAYVYEDLGSEEAGGFLGGVIITEAAAKGQIFAELGDDYIQSAPLEKGKNGVSMVGSSFLGSDQMIDLTAVWKYAPPFNLFGSKAPRVLNRARVRAFTGYDNTRKEDLEDEKGEEVVFITPTGRENKVYHTSRNCTALNPSVEEVSAESLGGRRNSSGGKYYPCEFCGGREGGGKVYITDYGDRYHKLASCPALKRTVTAVPLSELSEGGWRACRKCGGIHGQNE